MVTIRSNNIYKILLLPRMVQTLSKKMKIRREKQFQLLHNSHPNTITPFQVWQNYPGLLEIVMAKRTILYELYQVLTSTTWSEYGNGTYEDQPEFTDMDSGEIIHYLRSKYRSIEGTKKWRLFGLIANGKSIPENINQTPETYSLGKQVPGILNLGFSLLEAGGQTDIHQGYDPSFYRFHLPLVIPESVNEIVKCFFWVDGRKVDWSEPFMFDDTRIHGAWNISAEDRYVLLIDVLR